MKNILENLLQLLIIGLTIFGIFMFGFYVGSYKKKAYDITSLDFLYNEKHINNSNFEKAFKFVEQNEGGYVNNKNDSGEATIAGLSLRYLKTKSLLEGDFNKDGKIDEEDIKALAKLNKTLREKIIKKTFKEDFWKPIGGNLIYDINVATKCFDIAILCGIKQAVIIIQKAINSLHIFDISKLSVDGVIGWKTINAINQCPPLSLIGALCKFYSERLASLAKGKNKAFEKGWQNRAMRVPQ